MLDRDNMFRCEDGCNTPSQARVCDAVLAAPAVLCVSLKRFQCVTGALGRVVVSKIDTAVAYTRVLSLPAASLGDPVSLKVVNALDWHTFSVNKTCFTFTALSMFIFNVEFPL